MSAKVKFTFSLRVDENNKHNLTLGSLSLMIYLNKKYVVIYATRVYKALVFFTSEKFRRTTASIVIARVKVLYT
jgi:hypothetical protein